MIDIMAPYRRRLAALVDRVKDRLWRILLHWSHEVAWLLEYEPTWFPEFGFAIGAIGWGVGAFFTDDILVKGWAWLLPCLAILGGIGRGLILLRLWYGARVIFAALGALLWAWLWWGFAGHYGAVPMMGVLFGVFVIEMLTAAKFSIPCLRELIAEFQGSRHQP